MADKVINIFKRMADATAEINAVAKNLSVGYGKSSYKAAGEADVLAAVKSVEPKHGIYSYPYKREIIETGAIEASRADGSSYNTNYLRVEVTYRFVNTDDPSDYIEVTSYGDGYDTGDKATGKAMTYADKYALMKAYKIITGEDHDQYHSDGLKEKKEAPKTVKKAEPKRNGIDARMQMVLSQAIQKAGKKPSELESLKGIKGWADITVEMFDASMKELGEQ